jgi:hypothetical protein
MIALGEAGTAVIVLKPDTQVTAKELLEHCDANLVCLVPHSPNWR